MKYLTLIPSEGRVYIDRVGLKVDLSDMDPAIHAVQWSETYGRGEIEFINDPYAPPDQYKPNKPIWSREPYQKYIEAWSVAKREDDRMAAEMRKQEEELRKQMEAFSKPISERIKNAATSQS